MQVKCRNHQNGCEWVGELRSLEQHCDTCTYVKVDCPNSCGELVQRRLLSSHLEEKCSKRHFNYAYCGHESTHEDVTTVHWPVCDRYPVACPNNCGKERGIPRCELEQHKSNECPLQEVKCKYEYAGCETTLPRKEIDTHMETGMKEHLQLVERYAEELKCEKESTENVMIESVMSKSRELREFRKRNCVYTDSLWNGRLKTCVFYPLYGPGYRIQMWLPLSSSSGQMAITIGVVGPKISDYIYNLTWPLKVIVTIELIDPTGRLDPISQSKRCIWNKPAYRETNTTTFDPFVSWAQSNLYAQGRDKKLTFNIYLCQPGRHPEDNSYCYY